MTLSQLTQDLRPARLLPALTAGFVLAVLEVVFAVSFAALIFNGPLSGFIARGIGFALMGSCLAGVVIALTSSLPGVVGGSQDVPAAILGVVATAVVAQLAVGVPTQQALATVIAAITLTTLLTGLFFFALGYFKWGGLVRFLPYPVIGGFLAGTGWLLLSGAVSLMADTLVDIAHFGQLFQPETLLRWVPGALFALLLLVLSARIRHFLFMPGMILSALVVFYLAAWGANASIPELSSQGWLLGPFPEGGIWQPFSLAELRQVHWPVLWGQAVNFLAIIVVSSVALLLNATGLELAARQDVDLNREMRSAGLGNLLAGLGGGLVNYQQLSLSVLNVKLGADSRLTGLFCSVLCGLVLIFGGTMLAIFPKIVVGGLLLYLGLALLKEWVVDSWLRFPRVDYAIIWMILLAITTIGFLEGVAVGIVAAVVMFVVNYSGVNVIKHSLPGTAYRSRVTRSTSQRKILEKASEQVHIFQLQGFLFFGTAHHLLEKVRQRINEPDLPAVRSFILDFHQVTGLDSTAMLSFAKMKQLAESRNITFLFTGLSPSVQDQFAKNDLEETTVIHILPDLDRGFEWCETEILQTANAEIETKTLQEHLLAVIPDGEKINALIAYLDRLEIAQGTYLIRQGEASDEIFFVESGQVTAQLEPEGQPLVRLETMRGGRVVGEIGFYHRAKRTACVVADEPTVVYQLTFQKLQALEENDPEAASTFHRIIVHLTTERVAHLIRAVDALQR